MAKKITWHTEKVKVVDLIENPHNPKKPDAKGRERLIKSLKKFGVVSGGVCNKDNMLIDGHSRKDIFMEMGVKEVEVRKPSRMLTEKEYRDFNAIYDLAKASDPDTQMIEETFPEEFLTEWDLKKEKENIKAETIELKPYKRTHILLSFPPEKLVYIQEHLQKIIEYSFVEYEQGNN